MTERVYQILGGRIIKSHWSILCVIMLDNIGWIFGYGNPIGISNIVKIMFYNRLYIELIFIDCSNIVKIMFYNRLYIELTFIDCLNIVKIMFYNRLYSYRVNIYRLFKYCQDYVLH